MPRISILLAAVAARQKRTSREPHRAIWKLDLSFAFGSMAGVLSAKREQREALAYADKAVALREEAVALEPDEDFAKGALARGYERQAALRNALGDVPGAVDAQMRRVAVYDRRLRHHPDREHFVREYLFVAPAAADASLGYLEKGRVSRDFRRSAARRIEGVLMSMARQHRKWVAANPSEATRPGAEASRAEFDRAIARCLALQK